MKRRWRNQIATKEGGLVVAYALAVVWVVSYLVTCGVEFPSFQVAIFEGGIAANDRNFPRVRVYAWAAGRKPYWWTIAWWPMDSGLLPYFRTTSFFGVYVPLWVPMLAAASPSMRAWWGERRRRKRLGNCVKCGYDLRGLRAGAVCPECGTGQEVAG